MKHFTKSQIDEIQKALATWGVRDTDFDDASILRETDFIAIVRDGMNRKISPSVFCKAAAEYVADELTVTSAYDIAVENGFEGTEAEWLETLFLAQVIDNLNSTDATKALSAKQGKVLKDMINNLPSYTVKTWSQIRSSSIDTDSTSVLANAKTAYELYRRRVAGVSVSWPTLSLTFGDSSSLTASLSHTHPSYEQAIAALQQAVETGTGGSGNASLVDNGSYYTLGVGNVQTDIYSKNQIDGKKLSIAGIDAGLGDTITANALKTALGISGSGASANAVLDIGSSYDTLTVTIDGVPTTDTFYNKAQVDALIQGGGGGTPTPTPSGASYALSGDVNSTGSSTVGNVVTLTTAIQADKIKTNMISNEQVTEAKLATNAVTKGKIKDGEVNGLKLNTLAKSITLWGKQFNIGGDTGELATVVKGDIKYVGKIQFVDPLAPTGTTLVETLEVVNIGTTASPSYALHSTLPFYSDGFVSAGGLSSGSGGGGGSLPPVTVGKFLKGKEGAQGAASTWAAADVTLADIKADQSSSLASDLSSFMNRAFPSATENQVLKFNGTSWELGVASLPNGDSTNKLLKWNSSLNKWEKGTISDILGASTANYVLMYKDGSWSPQPLPASTGNLTPGNGISIVTANNVSTVSAKLEEFGGLEFNSSGEIKVTVPEGSGFGGFTLWEDDKPYTENPSINTTAGDAAGKYYRVRMNGAGKLYVNVPWTGGGSGGYTFDSDNFDVDSNNVVSLNPAAPGDLGGVSLWQTASAPSGTVNTISSVSDRYYAVEMNPSGQLYVNVPWSGGSGGGEANVIEGVSLNGSAAPIANKIAALTINYGNSAITPASNGTINLKTVLDNNYLPLSAGSSYPLTGTLYSNDIVPDTAADTERTDGYDLGGQSSFYKDLYVRRIYLYKGSSVADDIYIEYDDTNDCARLHGDLVVTGAVTAGSSS